MANKKSLPKGFRYIKDRPGLIEYRFTYEGSRRSVTGDTVTKCYAAADELRAKLREHMKVSAQNLTFEKYTEEWLEALEHTTRKATRFSYKKKLKSINAEIGSIKLVDLDRRDIVRMQSKFAKQYATSTTNYYISLTRQILNVAIADRIIVFNPCNGVKALPRKEKKATQTIHRALTTQEQEVFFRYAADSWYYEIFSFMVLTGCRVGEVGALHWEDVDAKSGMIHIQGTVTQEDYTEMAIGPTKTEAGYRDIPLTDALKKILASQKKRISTCVGLKYLAPDQRVFYSELDHEALLTDSAANHAIDAVLKKLNKDGTNEVKITHFTSHAFRDTFATRCIEQGMEANTLKTLLGHTKIAMTMDLYAQVLKDTKIEALKEIAISV